MAFDQKGTTRVRDAGDGRWWKWDKTFLMRRIGGNAKGLSLDQLREKASRNVAFGSGNQLANRWVWAFKREANESIVWAGHFKAHVELTRKCLTLQPTFEISSD